MRCLITGVAGFIGSHLAERLLAEGHEVVGVDCFTPYYPPAIKRRNLEPLALRSSFRFVEADLAEADLTALVDGVEWVFHLAGQPGVRESWGATFAPYLRNNLQATQRLVEALAAAPPHRLVYASSSSVYGDVPLPMSESALPRPLSPYGVTKVAAEHLLHAYGMSAGVPVTSLRFFTVYGPRQRPDMAFHRFIQAIARGEPISLYGDGRQTRDFTYVEDVVEACRRAAARDCAGEVINVGGGSSATVNQVLAHLGELLELPVHVKRLPRQQGDARHTQASVTRAQALLGWRPAVTWAEGLRRQVEWQAERATLPSRRTIVSLPRSHAASPRLLIYGHDTYGLGHVRRNLTIAHGLTRAFPDLSILLLTGSPAVHNLSIPDNVDYIKLPSVVKVADEDYRARTLRVGTREIVRMRAALIGEAVKGFAPDAVLVDHAPAGMKGEMLPALEELRRTSPHTRVVLGLRDIVDQPEWVRAHWKAQGTYEVMERLYDAILVYGTPQVLDVAASYDLTPTISEKMRYCGYLRREASCADAAAARTRFCPANERLIVVTAGGGGDGYPLFSAYLKGLGGSEVATNAVSVIVAGPFLPAPERAELARLADGSARVHVLDFTDDLLSLMQAADLVVCMGGYNTLCEVLSVGALALVVPRVEPRREQLLRAQAFAALGLVGMLSPDTLTPMTLMGHVNDLLSDRSDRRPRIQRAIASFAAAGGLDGLEATVRALGGLLDRENSLSDRREPAVAALS